MVNPRGGTFTPSPAQQTIVTGVTHSPHGSHHSTFSAGASPSTNSPTGSNPLTKIVVAQVYLLLTTIKDDKDRTKWEQKAEQLKKLIGEHGMEVFQKYFSRLVVGNAPQIFPGLNRPAANTGTYQLLVNEVRKVSHNVDQAGKIAESIETANEDLFRDFDLSTFMEHFKLDALEKTILALAFKTGSRSDLKTKADAILSANYNQFLQAIAQPNPDHEDLTSSFLATIIDRFIQEHPPNFDQQAQQGLITAISYRFSSQEQDPAPTEVLAALYLIRALNDRNTLALYMQRIGKAFTADQDSCTSYLRNVGKAALNEEQTAAALTYSVISRTSSFSATVLVNSIRKEVSHDFDWQKVMSHFDQPDLRISQAQFLNLFRSLEPLAKDKVIDIQQLWGSTWQNTETQLSFINAFASLTPEQLDATTIPGLEASFKLEDYEESSPEIRERAARAVKHPLVSVACLTAIFHVALHTPTASDTVEAKRLFQEVVVPNLDIFLVSAFSVKKPWPELANETATNLFDRFLYKCDHHYDFVFESLWRKDKTWVAQRLVEAHAKSPMDLPNIMEIAIKHKWLDELVHMLNGFGLDLAAHAHAEGLLDLENWARVNSTRQQELAQSLLTFLNIKAQHELAFQRSEQKQLHSLMLLVKTVLMLLETLENVLPKEPSTQLIHVQRACITAYPRLINYGQGFDEIIDSNGKDGNSLPLEANAKMEEHYKRMYSDDLQVKNVVEALDVYKHSRDPADQEVFACMIHGLFDEYTLYGTYPLEALATTAVLFGGIISHKLISDLPLEIGLGMILEAVRDNAPDQPMYKFGLQALMQLFSRLREWPGFCRQLLLVPGLRGTEAYNKADEVVRDDHDEMARNGLGGASQHQIMNGGGHANGNIDEMLANETSAPPFSSLNVDPSPLDAISEEPSDDAQDKVLFVLNNITAENLEMKFAELKDIVNEQHQQWFAGHLVEERAKLQPNYHNLYLSLVKLFGRKSLWAEVIRETYISAFRALNSEGTMQSQVERSYLKNLGSWLGSLTLARDKPIRHRNIAFKELLLEAFDTQRLVVVIPFVCKVLVQGKNSMVFKPPNPWLMDIIHLLIELYHNAELKLNLKFEIEVLCSDLGLDHKSIEPSSDILNRIPPTEGATETMAPEIMETFENMSLNGMGGAVGSGRFSPHEITSSIPDLGPLLVYPPANDLVNQARLQEIVRTAITRAVHEIISPVVERSVTIAALSTREMIKKDFATEPNEHRVRAAAINMVKNTAGSLALVTSKEPLRASMTNYIRALSVELPQALPEGTIIMCVNSNLDLACSQVEKKAEERAIPEIEDMLEGELEARRHHRMTRPGEPYVDPSLNRWSWTIPDPYKLQPSLNGLNQEQMAIYDEFARQPRATSLPSGAHIPSSSDATRSMTNDLLQEQYPNVPSLPTPAETPAMPHLNNTQPSYGPQAASIPNGRPQAVHMDPRAMLERTQKTLIELQRVAVETPEQHYLDLPRPHPVLDVVDALYGLIIRSAQGPECFDILIVDHIVQLLFSGVEEDLVVECLVHVLETICRIGGRTASRVSVAIGHQPNEGLLSLTLVLALIRAEMIEWHRIDSAAFRAMEQRKDGSLEFFSSLMDAVLLNDRPVALYADFAKSLEIAWQWIEAEPTFEAGQLLKQKLTSSGLPPVGSTDDSISFRQDQMDYVFEEWVHLCKNTNISDKAAPSFIAQMYNKQVINNRDDLCLFLRLSIDSSVHRFETTIQNTGLLNDAYVPVDSLAKLIVMLVTGREMEGEVKGDKAAFLKSVLSLAVLVLNHHHVVRGQHFNQKVFFRLFSSMLREFQSLPHELTEIECQEILLTFARSFLDLQPAYFPGFMFAWLELICYRDFLPLLMRLPEQAGWGPLAELMETLLSYFSELLKPLHVTPIAKEVYRGVLKVIVVLQHDFPDFVAANHARLCANIPNHCMQLRNLILNANPAPFAKMPDPFQPGLKIDRIEEIREPPPNTNDVEGPLRQLGLFEVIDQALQSGPSEDAVAHIAHAIQRRKWGETRPGALPSNVDLQLIDALVLHVGTHAIARATQKGGPTYVQASPDVALLSMLIHELQPEARYYFLSAVVNQLRFPNAHTHYFSQVLLDLFGSDQNDQEESEIRQQVTRVLLERFLGHWPQPWGLTVTILELVKNEKYMFFDLPFIKASPDVAERFMALAQRSL